QLRRVRPEDLLTVVRVDPVEALRQSFLRLRPSRSREWKLRRPKNIFGADILPHAQARAIVPPDQITLPFEHLRRHDIVAVLRQLIARRLKIRIFQKIGAPAETALGQDDPKVRKAEQNSRDQEVYQHGDRARRSRDRLEGGRDRSRVSIVCRNLDRRGSSRVKTNRHVELPANGPKLIVYRIVDV